MVKLTLKNDTTLPYAEVRDAICKALVGNRAFVENDIIVSDFAFDADTGEKTDDNQAENTIVILLGSEGTPCIELKGSVSGFTASA